jgi:hypothetical protein
MMRFHFLHYVHKYLATFQTSSDGEINDDDDDDDDKG